jgi:molybdate transport system substrate-binding protein
VNQRRRETRIAALVVAAALALGGCGASVGSAGTRSDRSGVTGDLTVFAAASLTESFTAIGNDFRAAHPGVRVTFNFAGSSTLVNQIQQGAPADVFAAANETTMKQLTDAGEAAGTPTTFAKNQLVIAVPKRNPAGVAGLVDLARPGVKVALCAERVPCGAAAVTALRAAGVRLAPVTLEQDVKAALAKVRLGEVDAALVYRTDARAAAADVDAVEFAESAGAVNAYPIVVCRNAPNPGAANAFVAYVLSDSGRSALARAGFASP